MIFLPPNFESDIQGQNLNLTTLVQITQLNGDKIYISTGSINFDGNYYNPILLNIPSVKESMDFENRKYKISNCTISVSNYEVGGSVFSDSLIDSDGNYIINARVDIYWKSQSGTTIDDCLNIYNAIIRRVSHDDEKCTLQLEDSSQKDLHKDVPVARLGDGVTIPDKYRNKPYPMVYGYVDKSPCVIAEISSLGEELTSFDEINIYTDSDDTVVLPENDPLYLYNDAYINIRKTEVGSVFKDEDENPLYGDGEQYSVLDNIITLLPSYEDSDGDNDDDAIPTNAIADNHIIGFEKVSPSVVKPLTGLKSKGIGDFVAYDAYYSTIPETTAVYTEDEGLFRIYGTCFVEDLGIDWGGQSLADPEGSSDITWDRPASPDLILEAGIVGCVMTMPVLSSSIYSDHVGKIRAIFKASSYNKTNWYGSKGDFRIRLGGNTVGDYDYLEDFQNQTDGTEANPDFIFDAQPTFNNIDPNYTASSPQGSLPGDNYVSEGLDVQNVSELLFYFRWLPTATDDGYQKGICVAQLEVIDLYVEHYVLLDDILKYGYYATVNGRNNGAYE